MTEIRTRRYAAALAAVIVLTVLNAYALNTFDVVGIPFIFATALGVQLLLLIFFAFSLVMVLLTPLKITLSILISAWQGVLTNLYVVSLRRRYPRLTRWVGQRFSRDRPQGLILTAGIAAAATSMLLFANITRAVVLRTSFAGLDERILNLVPHIHSPDQNAVFSVLTFAAGPTSFTVFLIVLTVTSWRSQQRWLPVLFAGAFLVSVAGQTLANALIRRPGPDRSLGLLTGNSFSFPSGSTLTATVVAGLVAYVLVRVLKSGALRLLILLVVVTGIMLVGLSRTYLGVEYPSDVLGGLALGLFFLSLLITAVEITERFHLVKRVSVGRAAKRPLLIATAAAALLAVTVGAAVTPLTEVQPQSQSRILPSLNADGIRQLPVYSETLTGARMEPINFIYLGEQPHIEENFIRAGWFKADPSTPGNTLRAILVALRNEQYLTAPVTPSYLNSEPETVAFEKPTDTNTLVQRHHTRLWKTTFTLDGQPVWVATASFDKGIGIGTKSGLPTHHIDPNVDAERSFILQSLNITTPRFVHVVDAQLGHNATGDGFFTDGQAAVINLTAAANTDGSNG
ncbi:phosphatase PAP2 family protein [Arthrobacter sp. PAMC25564]|uniref:LssY C-terminal domain-containing protein n=1 Tax=Arthrobacter sp. PAMC25564 TaxID=2565366 RepID=UPI0010A20286|nr:LssY C-terminal domain-containing protein [Arthrobacter sp. PAMC25564]QCB96809.1 phosphatase PAP2 family protein [Arthrobacter sp. PAMC25564]